VQASYDEASKEHLDIPPGWCLAVFAYICIYIYVYVNTSIYVYVYIYIYKYIYIYHICTYVCIYDEASEERLDIPPG